ncbi:MAG: OmpH family outer membrane protein [Bacteroidaceae bacterium]|nr:OmpH family outer membrane protein [Bacteroidaceae bacterium]
MLKKIGLALALFLLPLGAMAQLYFAHTNSQNIISEMREYKTAMATLESMQKKYQDELNRVKDDFNAKYQSYLADVESLPRNIAERRQKELQDLATRQEQFQQEALQSLQLARQEAMTPIRQKVSEAIRAVAEADGYIYVFDLSTTPIAYVSSQSVDITDKVKAQLGIR